MQVGKGVQQGKRVATQHGLTDREQELAVGLVRSALLLQDAHLLDKPGALVLLLPLQNLELIDELVALVEGAPHLTCHAVDVDIHSALVHRSLLARMRVQLPKRPDVVDLEDDLADLRLELAQLGVDQELAVLKRDLD